MRNLKPGERLTEGQASGFAELLALVSDNALAREIEQGLSEISSRSRAANSQHDAKHEAEPSASTAAEVAAAIDEVKVCV